MTQRLQQRALGVVFSAALVALTLAGCGGGAGRATPGWRIARAGA